MNPAGMTPNSILRNLFLVGSMAIGMSAYTTQAQETPCGTVDVNRTAPTTAILADVDGDGVRERYVANFGNIQKQQARDGSTPTVWEVVLNIPVSAGGPQYCCVDLIAYDRDGDGDLDMAHASPHGVTDFENRVGELIATDFYPTRYSATAHVRLEARDINHRGLVDLAIIVRDGESLIIR